MSEVIKLKEEYERSSTLVWVDLETPGFAIEDGILEASIVVTDNDLNELGIYTSLVADVDPDLLIPNEKSRTSNEQILCWDKHWETGLVDDLKALYDNDGILPTLEEVQSNMVSLLNSHGIVSSTPMMSRPPLCGSTVASFDRPRIKRFFPHVFELLHYRNIDVSSVRELQKRWEPQLVCPEKSDGHRAEADIRESISFLRHFRTSGFIGL